jgi:hypothetical protein
MSRMLMKDAVVCKILVPHKDGTKVNAYRLLSANVAVDACYQPIKEPSIAEHGEGVASVLRLSSIHPHEADVCTSLELPLQDGTLQLGRVAT